jgi:predicted nucleic acid-binding protein
LIVLDTSFFVALYHEPDAGHLRAVSCYEQVREQFATTPMVLAEIDYMVHTRCAPAALGEFYREIHAGSLGVEWWPQLELQAAEVADRHAGLGLVDASLIVLAARLETNRIASFDERHFRAVEPLDGSARFELLPADA